LPIQIDQLIRARRKTIALIVQADGTLTVRAPLRASLRQIQAIVDEKAGWIRARQEQARAAYTPAAAHRYVDGEAFWFLGTEYPLKLVDRTRKPLDLDGAFLLARSTVPRAPDVFKDWYRDQALAYISKTAGEYAARGGFHYQKIRITSAQTRWGSCSSTGTLSFTWRLIMAPRAVVDYVIVHELVHTVEHNHAKTFWDRVAAIVPDYKAKVAWLKVNGRRLAL
jgi:predicted metal-dependent hydrolase